jgi:uncharacterized protein YjiS (DUF1127 family)
MIMNPIRAGAACRHPSSMAKAMLNLLAEAEKRRRIRRKMKKLSELPRHLLLDIGLEQQAAQDDPTIPHHWR